MARRVFVTGGSGFVGSSVIAELLNRGYGINALSNRKSIADGGDVRTIRGDLFTPAALEEGLHGCDAVIHLVGIIMEQPSKGITFDRIHFEGTKAVVKAAQHAGISRYVQMSAVGTRPDAVSDYHKTKYKAEQFVQNSLLDWTIIRPSLIHGPHGEFMKMEAMWARGKAPPPLFVQPFMPYFGGKSAGKLQPIYANDVARAFVDCLEKPQTVRKVYEIGGPDQITWPQMHEIVANAVVGHRRWVAPVPVAAAKFLVALGLGPTLGFNADQIAMSQEDNVCDLTHFVADFGWTPRAFAPLIKEYARML